MLQLDGRGRSRLVPFWGVLCAAAAVVGLPVSVQHMSENNELTLPDGSTWHRGPSGNVRSRLQSNDPKSFVHPLGHNEAGSIARKYAVPLAPHHHISEKQPLTQEEKIAMMHKKEMARTQRILKKKEQAKRQTEVVASAKPSQTYAEHIQMHHETMKKKMHEQYHAAKKQPKDECGGRVDVGEVHGSHCVCHAGHRCVGPSDKCTRGMTRDGRWYTGFSLISYNEDGGSKGCASCKCAHDPSGQSDHDPNISHKQRMDKRIKEIQVENQRIHSGRTSVQGSQPSLDQNRKIQHKAGSVDKLLEDGHLTAYIPYFRSEGYVLVKDLLDADTEELNAVVAGAAMKRPQERRFKALVASAKEEM